MEYSNPAVLSEMMVVYDKQFPDATPFQRGSVEYEFRMTLDWLDRMDLVVVPRYAAQDDGMWRIADAFDVYGNYPGGWEGWMRDNGRADEI